MIHYHGTPLTPQEELQKMVGKHFCVSFEEPRNIEWCVKHGQSVMLDNGAFSAFTKGKEIDFRGYEEWLEPYMYPPNWAVNPDVIDGSVEEKKRLIKQFGDLARHLVAPVWHMSLSIDWLLEMAEGYER